MGTLMIGLPNSQRAFHLAGKIVRLARRTRQRVKAQVHRLLDKAYYRALFGRRIPGAPGLTRKLAEMERRQCRGDTPVAKDVWESQYRAGAWTYLRQLDQTTRYSVIAGFIQALKRDGCLLDVGCGEGVLLDHLNGNAYSKFVGIDISQEAIDVARKKHYERSVFAQADGEDFVTHERFDAIVFNEVLYYFSDPLAVARKYCACLEPRGLLITSLYSGSDRARAIGRLLKKNYPSVEEVQITSHAERWVINVFAPYCANIT
jgi:2-polyprenyl-3-methyl-5-hydroxy-6-metoxy-1,4-benzoquinol methylase